MKKARQRTVSKTVQIEIFTVEPKGRYDVKTAARLADVPTKTMVSYYRAGLVPASSETGEAPRFDDESIHIVRQIERLRSQHGINLTGVKMIVELMEELRRLRSEVRFWREW